MHSTAQIDTSTGLLIGARQVLSPHFDQRPAQILPTLIVVHGISLPAGEFGTPWIDRLFTGNLPADGHESFKQIALLEVSAHAVIRRAGAVTQYVPFPARAWHAGKSSYQGHDACNDFSIGIELEGSDAIAYTQAQYLVLAQLVGALCHTYPTLSTHHLVGHSDIAPGRKTDPGEAFEWARLRSLLV